MVSGISDDSMIDAFRSYRPLRLVLAATRLLGTVLPVAQMICSSGDVAASERPTKVFSAWHTSALARCHHMAAGMTASMEGVDRCHSDTSVRGLEDCTLHLLEVAEMLPAPPTEELSRFFAAQLSLLPEFMPDHFSEVPTGFNLSRGANLDASHYSVPLRVLFSSFLI